MRWGKLEIQEDFRKCIVGGSSGDLVVFDLEGFLEEVAGVLGKDFRSSSLSSKMLNIGMN